MTKTQIINFFSDFVKIQSVSTDKNRFLEIEKAVSFLKNFLLSLGFSVKILEKEKAQPLILATLIKDEKAKTLDLWAL
jgi:hypothetical protein